MHAIDHFVILLSYFVIAFDFLLVLYMNHITNAATNKTAAISRYIEYLSIFFQFVPRLIPIYVSIEFHTIDPAKV